MTNAPKTWHYGLVAKWWAEFNEDGDEIAYFQKYVERGQPALDVACGTGRLLIPYLREGLDVDGCDVSADMIALCREKAEREGLSTRRAPAAVGTRGLHRHRRPRRPPRGSTDQRQRLPRLRREKAIGQIVAAWSRLEVEAAGIEPAFSGNCR
jgi:SAM-dependent methyltransferase